MEESEDRAATDPLLKKLLELCREMDGEDPRQFTGTWPDRSDADDRLLGWVTLAEEEHGQIMDPLSEGVIDRGCGGNAENVQREQVTLEELEKLEAWEVKDPMLKELLRVHHKINAECAGRPAPAGWLKGSDFDVDDAAGNCDDVAENEERNGSMSAGDDDVGA